MSKLVLRAISTAPPNASKAFEGGNNAALRAAWIKYRGPVKPTMKRARQGGIWKRDLTDKEKTLATIGAGAAIGGGTALALKLKAKPKAKLPKDFADFKLDTVKLDTAKPDTVILDTDPPKVSMTNILRQRKISSDKIKTQNPSAAPESVPNPVSSTPEQIAEARAKSNQRAAARRISLKQKAREQAMADEAAERARLGTTALDRGEQLPNGAGRIKKGPNGTLVDTVPWGRSIFGKSYAKVGGKIVTMTPAQMKARGLRPASHKSMQGVTAKDKQIARDVSASWQEVKRIASGKEPMFTDPMMKPKTRSRTGRRTIKHGDVGPFSPFQNFSATAALPTKNGMQVGSQRQAPGIVAVNRNLKPYQQRDYKKHELQHVSVRKPMSRDVRFQRHPEKLWGDEARADSVMSPKSQRRSLYNISAKLGFIPAPPGTVPARYTEGFKNGGRAKYKEVQAKIRQAHGEQAPVKHTKRNIAIIGTGAGVGAGGATGAYLYNQNRKKNG